MSHSMQPTFLLRKPIVLVGMMGCGKTAIGKALATRLQVPFVDSDAAIEQAAATTIADIFARDGEPFFRKREAEVIERLLTGHPCVLSTGGGAFLSDTVRASITAKGASVWLDVPLATLWDRVRTKDTRPLLRTPNPRQTLSDIFDARVPVYRQAQIHAQISGHATIEQTTDLVLDCLKHHPAILESKP